MQYFYTPTMGTEWIKPQNQKQAWCHEGSMKRDETGEVKIWQIRKAFVCSAKKLKFYPPSYGELLKDFKKKRMTLSNFYFRKITLEAVWRTGRRKIRLDATWSSGERCCILSRNGEWFNWSEGMEERARIPSALWKQSLHINRHC